MLKTLATSATEILLAHRGIEKLGSFERFKCVEALWLNDNALSRIDGLEHNMQIKALYLHTNRILSLKGALQKLRHIRILTLYNNMLQDLISTLPLMEHLHHLEELGALPSPQPAPPPHHQPSRSDHIGHLEFTLTASPSGGFCRDESGV